MANPKQRFLRLSKSLLRYLNGTRKLGITYKGNGFNIQYSIFTDATWGTEDDRKSFMGFIMMYNGGPISWQAQRQKSTAQSTLEAEIISANEGEKEASYLEKIWKDIVHQRYIPILYCDNDPAVQFMKDSKFHSEAKHIELRYLFICNDMVAQSRLRVQHLPGKDMIADILTKQLPEPDHIRHRDSMGLVNRTEPWNNQSYHQMDTTERLY
ncbi:hypothetical protein K3495_g11105 [Podosphaera aphanis]|nr:hypothetical protein K3495_g11105 [Podosphaera aphanis]